MTKELNDVLAERSVLAGLIQHGEDAFIDIDGLVNNESFTQQENIILWNCLTKLFEESKKVDYLTLVNAAKSAGYTDFTKHVTKEYFNKLASADIALENVKRIASKLCKFHIARRVDLTAASIRTKIRDITGDESVSEIIAVGEIPFFEFASSLDDQIDAKPELVGDDIMEYIQYLRDNPTEMIGISSGFTRFDKAIGGGFRRGSVDLIAARPKTGKSMFADAVTLHVAGKLGIPVLLLDTEMSKRDHQQRMLANLSDIEINDIATSQFDKSQGMNERIEKAGLKISSIPFHFRNIAGRTFEETLSLMRRWIVKEVGFDENGQTNPCLIIYDYFKLTTSSDMNDMKEYQALGYQMQEMVNFTIKYDVPCLSFVQLNKEGATKETVETVSGSDRLSWFASSVTMFKRKSAEEIAEDNGATGNRKLVPLIARHGSGLPDEFDYINMTMIGEFGRIKEGLTKSECVLQSKKEKEGFDNTLDDKEQDFIEEEVEDLEKPF
tara:strand:+ start:5795 stop:7282 length:1488 start_codon:yes stop_codon:yes gene_type:complete